LVIPSRAISSIRPASIGTPSPMVSAERMVRSQCRSRSGATPSKARAPSKMKEDSHTPWQLEENSGSFMSRQSPST
jgi:hypothetical protein